jgi:aminoglycoside phosphotransferase (APT) family kinase protein
MTDEIDAQRAAESALSLKAGAVLKDLPGRRRITRYGELVVKSFATIEADAFERERAGLLSLASTGLAPALFSHGESWVATAWLDGEPIEEAGDDAHRSLGRWLARLHAVDPAGLPPWPLAQRLRAGLSDPPDSCPADLVEPLAAAAERWIPHLRSDTFVHGDWGDSNVLANPEDPTDIRAIIDFEDCHVGDAAEDFRWQAMTGPASTMLAPMLQTYGDMGPYAGERIAAATTELIIDVLSWYSAPEEIERAQRNCLPTLRALIDGWLPAAAPNTQIQ